MIPAGITTVFIGDFRGQDSEERCIMMIVCCGIPWNIQQDVVKLYISHAVEMDVLIYAAQGV